MEKQSYFRDALTADEKLEPIPGIIELLDEIKRARVKIGLASSSVRSFIALVLNNLEINHYFDAVVSGEDVKRSKPQPDIFLKAAEKLQVSPDACLVIEDSQHGVKAAIQAGMTCIGFNNPNSGSQDLSRSYPCIIHN